MAEPVLLKPFQLRGARDAGVRCPTGVGSQTAVMVLLCSACAALHAQALQAQQVSQAQQISMLPSAPLPNLAVPPQGTPRLAEDLGQISGVVTDTQGALVGGAQIQLLSAGNTAAKATQSGPDGQFRFVGVPAGHFTITLRAAGFTSASTTGNLLPGQHFEMPTFALQPATVNITVNATASPEELATEELHIEEQQRLVGLFPNFFVSYNWTAPALSPKQKFSLSLHNAIDPGNLFLVGTTAGVQQADNAFPGYHQGAAGYGKRYGADLGNLVVGTFMGGAILPVLFHQDPRYFYKGTGTIKQRALYALSTAVICRGDNGHRQPAFASVLGDLSAGAISNLYYAPSDRQGATLTFENGLLGIAGDAMNNLFQEFFLRRLAPKANKKSDTP
ncbi:MAG: carboxypeptidase-like regulatory domain-containing protein [Janthinobacterium lividum]